MRQTRMAKGDFHISRRPSHADFNIAYSEVKVRMPNQLKTPSNKGKIKFDVSFHDGFRTYAHRVSLPRKTSRWRKCERYGVCLHFKSRRTPMRTETQSYGYLAATPTASTSFCLMIVA